MSLYSFQITRERRLFRWLFWLALGLGVLVACAVRAAVAPQSYPVHLNWTNSPDKEVIGYHVYYGQSGREVAFVDVGSATNYTYYIAPRHGRMWFRVCSYDDNGVESVLSNEVFSPPLTAVDIWGTNLESTASLPGHWAKCANRVSVTNDVPGALFVRSRDGSKVFYQLRDFYGY